MTAPPDLPAGDPPAYSRRERHAQRVRWLETVGPVEQLSRSVLLLSGFNPWAAGVADDPGLVSAAELSLMDLRGTQLVVLSACRSGVGSVDYADGSVIGIRNSCLVAGAAACLSSLWNVPDASTAGFMDQFHGELAAGAGRAEALRTCQLAMRERHPDPYRGRHGFSKAPRSP